MVIAVFRAPMRSRSAGVAEGGAVERALTRGVCGMGGVLAEVPASVDDAIAAAAREHDERLARRLARFADAPDAAFVWTRDVEGELWLGRLDGPYRYDAAGEAAAVDLVHVRPCRWSASPVSEAAAPAAVLATFRRGGRNWQQIHDADVGALSARLWDSADGGDRSF